MHELTLNDVARKFGSSVCLITDKNRDEKVCGFVTAIDGDPENLLITYVDGKEQTYTIEGEFNYLRPSCGFIPTQTGAIHIRRFMRGKNWAIGLNNLNTRVIQYAAKKQNSVEGNLLSTEKNPYFPDYTLKEARNYNALNKMFLWQRDIGAIYGIHQEVVAVFDTAEKIKVIVPEYKQELSDVVKRRKLPWQII